MIYFLVLILALLMIGIKKNFVGRIVNAHHPRITSWISKIGARKIVKRSKLLRKCLAMIQRKINKLVF